MDLCNRTTVKGVFTMCNNTKEKIAAALRQLMTERPFEKITVQNLMDATNMKRQSFYYHFQDTRDVLMWICRQELLEPLAHSDLPFTEWILLALTLLDKDRAFYRRLMNVAYLDFVLEFENQLLRQKLTALLFPGVPPQSLDDNQRFTVDFMCQAVSGRLSQFVHTRAPLNPESAHAHWEYLLNRLHIRVP